MSAAMIRNIVSSTSKNDLYRGAVVGTVLGLVVGTIFSWPKSAKIAIGLITMIAVTRLNSYQRLLVSLQNSLQEANAYLQQQEEELDERELSQAIAESKSASSGHPWGQSITS